MQIEATGKSVEIAIQNGLLECGMKREEVNVKVVEEGGLFKKAKVILSWGETKPEEPRGPEHSGETKPEPVNGAGSGKEIKDTVSRAKDELFDEIAKATPKTAIKRTTTAKTIATIFFVFFDFLGDAGCAGGVGSVGCTGCIGSILSMFISSRLHI